MNACSRAQPLSSRPCNRRCVPRRRTYRRQAEVRATAGRPRRCAFTRAYLPERTLLYALVQAHYRTSSRVLRPKTARCPSMCARVSRPTCCGVLEHGFLRVVCEHCRAESWWHSCRSAGCARAPARRMAESAHLVNGVFGPRPGAAMGAELSVPLAFPVRQQARSHWPGAGHRAARDRRLVGRSSRHRPRQRPVRRGDADPAFRQRAEPEHPLPHAVARRRVRGSHRAAAARTAPAPRPVRPPPRS